MTNSIAISEGFNNEVYGEYNGMELHLLVKPKTDFDSAFKAWDMDCQEFINVNGWLAEFNYC